MEFLVKHKEYEVENGRPLQVTVPVQWLRDRAKPGDRLGLFEDPKTHRLIIDILPPKNNEVAE
jgi:hypothetical protein